MNWSGAVTKIIQAILVSVVLFLFSLDKFRTVDSIKNETADWFPHQVISEKRKKIASLIMTLSGQRRGSTRLPILSEEVPVQQKLRELQDRIQAMKRIRANIDNKMQEAMDWLQNPVYGGIGEECLKTIIRMILRVAERSLPVDAQRLRNLADSISQKLRNEVIMQDRPSEVMGDIMGKLAKVLAAVLKATRDLERAYSKEEKDFNRRRQNNKRSNEDYMNKKKKIRRDK